MTIHNLNDHLSWLLTSRTSIPTSGPQALATETSLSSAGTAPVQNPQKRLPEGELDAFTCNLNRLCPGDGEIQPSHQSPSAPKISVNTRNSESMARLQSGPASTKKPKLISQSALDSRHTPNTHQDHDYGISLRDRYCPPYGAKASGNPTL